MKTKAKSARPWLCPSCGTNHGFATMRRGRAYARQTRTFGQRQRPPIRVHWPIVMTSRRGPYLGHLRPRGLCPDPFHDEVRDRFAEGARRRAGEEPPPAPAPRAAPDRDGAAERHRMRAVRHRAAQSKDRR